MLTKATTFDEALELASAGDSRKVNLLVKYGCYRLCTSMRGIPDRLIMIGCELAGLPVHLFTIRLAVMPRGSEVWSNNSAFVYQGYLRR
jgi:hypothetical protein